MVLEKAAYVGFFFAAITGISAIALIVIAIVEGRKGKKGWAWLAGIGAGILVIATIAILIMSYLGGITLETVEEHPGLAFAL